MVMGSCCSTAPHTAVITTGVETSGVEFYPKTLNFPLGLPAVQFRSSAIEGYYT